MKNTKRAWLGLIAALVIALGTMLPFFAHYSGSKLPTGLASLFGEKVLICTSTGFAWVKWSDLEKNKTPFKQHQDYECPLCYVSASNSGKATLRHVLYVTGANTDYTVLPPATTTPYIHAVRSWAAIHTHAPPV